MKRPFVVIDGQVHIWERNHSGQRWDPTPAEASGFDVKNLLSTYLGREMTAERMLDAMAQAGVDAAVIVSPFMVYGFDSSYAFSAARRYPGRFGVVSPVGPEIQALERWLADWREQPGALGLRLVTSATTASLTDVRFDRLFRLVSEIGVPLCVYRPDAIGELASVVDAHPDLRLVVDHLGLQAAGDSNWEGLPAVLRLADHANIAIKASALPVHSRRPFPFSDVWPHLHRVISAFGVERIMWGTDWTRVPNATYREGVDYFAETPELSEEEKAMLMGANLLRAFAWVKGGGEGHRGTSAPRPLP